MRKDGIFDLLARAILRNRLAQANARRYFLEMPVTSITYTFYDFEIEQVSPSLSGRGMPEGPDESSPSGIHLVKVLSVDGRRFTYEVHGDLTEEAVVYIKSLIDAVVFSDMIVERTAEGFEAREVHGRRLKKHS